jgi:hypothetical protein
VLVLRLADAARDGRTAWGSLVGLGTLTGVGFNLDFGSGPLLVGAVLGIVAWRTRRAGPVLAYVLAVAPWVAAGVGLNYAVGGVCKPLNMYPEHFQFPGSPFTEENMTGFLRHGPLDQILYAGAMLFGKHGFWNHNLPLLLGVATGWAVLRRPFPGRGELVGLLGWCTLTWLLYGVLSNNMGGGCCSVRWFVPFLAPGFWLLAVVLRDRPDLRPDFVTLAVWGSVLAGLMWWKGPWAMRMVPLMWPVVGCALLSWGVVAYRRGKHRPRVTTTESPADAPTLPQRRAA